MSLVTIPVDIDSNPPQVKDRKRNKVHPRTLLAHVEYCNGCYRILDLTNNKSEFPQVIVSKVEEDFSVIVAAVKSYKASKRYTKITISYITKSGMHFIPVEDYIN